MSKFKVGNMVVPFQPFKGWPTYTPSMDAYLHQVMRVVSVHEHGDRVAYGLTQDISAVFPNNYWLESSLQMAEGYVPPPMLHINEVSYV